VRKVPDRAERTAENEAREGGKKDSASPRTPAHKPPFQKKRGSSIYESGQQPFQKGVND